MTAVHSFKRWVQRSRGTAEHVRTIRAEIIPGTEEIVESACIDGQGRYIPPLFCLVEPCWVLLALSLVTICGAVAGSHGWSVF